MTDPALFHAWDGLTFGFDPDAEAITYHLVSSEGLEDFASTGGSLDVSGRDGRGLAPLWAEVGNWITIVEIWGPDADTWRARRDALKAATSPMRWRNTEGAYDITYQAEDTRTVFARPSRRIIPQDPRYLVKFFGEAQLAFSANDPLTYSPAVQHTLARGASWTFTSPGSEFSTRFRWVAPGPATNPRLTFSVVGFDDVVIRYVGTINDGQNLVVDSAPDHFRVEVSGVNRYGHMDGGVSTVICPRPTIAPGEQTVTFSAGIGAPSCTLTQRGAYI